MGKSLVNSSPALHFEIILRTKLQLLSRLLLLIRLYFHQSHALFAILLSYSFTYPLLLSALAHFSFSHPLPSFALHLSLPYLPVSSNPPPLFVTLFIF